MLFSRYQFVFWNALGLLGVALSSHAQSHSNGYIDTTFSAPCLANQTVNFTTRTLFVQPDGRILAGGNFVTPFACVNGIGRFRTNGATDTAFNAGLAANDFVTGIATQSNGKIIIGGRLSGSGTVFPLARLGANGGMDGTFQHLIGQPLVANALVVQTDDKIIIAGAATGVGGVGGFVARFNGNGSLDGSFTNGVSTGVSLNGTGISALALQSTKVLVGGSFTTYNDGSGSVNRDGLARLNSEGSLDVVFQPAISNADVRALLIQPDGKILAAGSFTANGQVCILTRLNPIDGSRDNTFTNLNVSGVTGLSLALDADGKILLGHTVGIMRLTANGTDDETFGPLNAAGFLGTDATFASAVALDLNGNVIVGAARVGVGATERRGLARLFATLPPPAVILTNPITQFVEAGTNVTFSVIATGAPPITYQWRKNGTAIKGATNSTLVLPNVHSTDSANYTVVISNPGGSVTSATAHLGVNFHTSPLNIVFVGAGTVKPNLDGKELEIGQTFTLTAKPASGNLFSNWTGFETTNSPVITFVMQSNEVLQVNFVASPFIPVKGVYNGLFYDTNAPEHENAGALTLKLDDRGGFSGTLRNGAKPRKFSGVFSLEDLAAVSVLASGTLPALHLALQIDTVHGVIFGTVSNNVATSSLIADRNPFSSAAPSPFVGNYNVVFPGDENPAGDGFATFKASANGKLSGRGTLADKTALKVISGTAVDGRVPVYVSLYRGSGSLFGWLTLTNENDLAGTVWWTKPGTVGGTFYPHGFTNAIEVLSERYTPRPAGVPVLPGTDEAIIVLGGNALSFTNFATLGSDNKLSGDNQLALTLAPAKGTLSGTFFDPVTAKKRAIKGLVLPNRNEAHGLFFGTDESGRVVVNSAP